LRQDVGQHAAAGAAREQSAKSSQAATHSAAERIAWLTGNACARQSASAAAAEDVAENVTEAAAARAYLAAASTATGAAAENVTENVTKSATAGTRLSAAPATSAAAENIAEDVTKAAAHSSFIATFGLHAAAIAAVTRHAPHRVTKLIEIVAGAAPRLRNLRGGWGFGFLLARDTRCGRAAAARRRDRRRLRAAALLRLVPAPQQERDQRHVDLGRTALRVAAEDDVENAHARSPESTALMRAPNEASQSRPECGADL
jgi:hypothetical protein